MSAVDAFAAPDDGAGGGGGGCRWPSEEKGEPGLTFALPTIAPPAMLKNGFVATGDATFWASGATDVVPLVSNPNLLAPLCCNDAAVGSTCGGAEDWVGANCCML